MDRLRSSSQAATQRLTHRLEKRSVEPAYRALSKIECLFATCIKNLLFYASLKFVKR